MRKLLRQSLPLFLSAAVLGAFFCQSSAKPKIITAQPHLNKNENNLSGAVSPERKIIQSITEKLIRYILNEQPSEIVKLVHPERAVYVDVKARMSAKELAAAWSAPESMLYALYWNTPLYRKISGDPKAECFRDILKKASPITLDITVHEERATAWLNFPGRPSPMMMGELTFEKITGKWYLIGLF